MEFGRTPPRSLPGLSVASDVATPQAQTTDAAAAAQKAGAQDPRGRVEDLLVAEFESILAQRAESASPTSASPAQLTLDSMLTARDAAHEFLRTFDGTDHLDLSALDSETLQLIAQLPPQTWATLKDFAESSDGHKVSQVTLPLPRRVADSAPLIHDLFEGLAHLDRLQEVFIVPRVDMGMVAWRETSFELDLSRLHPEHIKKIMFDMGTLKGVSTPEVRVQVTLPEGVDLPKKVTDRYEHETAIRHVASETGDYPRHPAPDTKAGPGLSSKGLAQPMEMLANQLQGAMTAAVTPKSQREIELVAELEGILAIQIASASSGTSAASGPAVPTAQEIVKELLGCIRDQCLDLAQIETATMDLVLQLPPPAWEALNGIAIARQTTTFGQDAGLNHVALTLTPDMAASERLMDCLCKGLGQLKHLDAIRILPQGLLRPPVGSDKAAFSLALKGLPRIERVELGPIRFDPSLPILVTLPEEVALFAVKIDGEAHRVIEARKIFSAKPVGMDWEIDPAVLERLELDVEQAKAQADRPSGDEPQGRFPAAVEE